MMEIKFYKNPCYQGYFHAMPFTTFGPENY